jgi:hypothetical protein
MIFFNINNNTSVVKEMKHFNSENGVDRALQQILERVCAKMKKTVRKLSWREEYAWTVVETPCSH